MTEAIRGDIITEARRARGDVHIQPGKRGGLQFRTLSHLDILLEADIITEHQYSAGMLYWRLRELMTRTENSLFADVHGDEQEINEQIMIDEITIDDPQTFLTLLGKRIHLRFRHALDAACAMHQGPRLILVHAFGDGMLRMAFEMLEEAVPKVYEEMKNRLQVSDDVLDSVPVSYV